MTDARTDADDGRPTVDAPKPDTGRAGIVVAGGRSERFGGREKALATLGDRALIAHAVDAVAPVGEEVVVNCRPDQREPFADALGDRAVRFAVDEAADGGPVAGLRTALRATDRKYAAVLPCDAPLVEPAFLAHLCERARRRTGAMPVVDGAVRPFPAAIHVRAAGAACGEALAADGSLDAFREALDPLVLDETEVAAFTDPATLRDVDTPRDLRRLRLTGSA